MTDDSYSRRAMLGGFSMSAAWMGSGAASASVLTAADATGPLPDFNDPQFNLDSIVKLIGSLEAVDCPWWYTGTIYAVRERTAPVPLVRFEGCEISHFRPWKTGGYMESARTTSFFRDYQTNEYLSEFKNPITGKTNKVGVNILGGDNGMHFSVNGLRSSRTMDKIPDKPLRLDWQVSGDLAWVIKDRGIPEPSVQPLLEAQSVFCRARDLSDRNLKSIDSWFSSTSFGRYPKWLEMDDQPGHTVWHASGRKLKSIEQLPPAYLARARAEYPSQLDASPKS